VYSIIKVKGGYGLYSDECRRCIVFSKNKNKLKKRIYKLNTAIKQHKKYCEQRNIELLKQYPKDKREKIMERYKTLEE